MKQHHFLMLVIVAAIFYIVGAKYPGLAAKIPGLG
jgi:hypothetical protein